ncbi:hypothetical protein GCM10009837_21120 [Streptomyces durmitorensis]|uniref:Uncharacterized protein n=1 Tax=Streptomyces durmitorensis TaxID=319947 RepID=A0ABY4PQ43_9ACTN|nr:hypothetical protein [Streptomyces durmitorensis]UQT55242.1 hypothetical protein M4V62_09105 [Streptomyces durmitorensis]
MGLFDKLTGTRHPTSGVTPRSADEVRAALLGLDGPDVPYRVRRATPAENADLVAEWRILEPAWHTFFVRTQLDRTIKTRMRLVPDSHEVRTVDEQWQVSWVGDTPRLAQSREYSRGQVTMKTRQWTYERGADGKLHKKETFSFDPAEMKEPLREAVLGAGWVWRGVVFKL